MERVFHNAKIGDIVYSLPAIYRRGGVKEYHIQREHAAEYLRPLLESQPYIGAVIHSKKCPDDVDINFENFNLIIDGLPTASDKASKAPYLDAIRSTLS